MSVPHMELYQIKVFVLLDTIWKLNFKIICLKSKALVVKI